MIVVRFVLEAPLLDLIPDPVVRTARPQDTDFVFVPGPDRHIPLVLDEYDSHPA